MSELAKLKEKVEDLKVLFVDDEEHIRKVTMNFLGKFFNNIQSAVDGKEALELFKEEGFDIVITDIQMPKLDGIELAKEIRSIKPDTYIVFSTAFREYVDSNLYDQYITKPASYDDTKELLLKLNERF